MTNAVGRDRSIGNMVVIRGGSPARPVPNRNCGRYEAVSGAQSDHNSDSVPTEPADPTDNDHPQPVLDLLYGLYRSAYYGPRDLESVEIGNDRTTGAVSSIALDSPGPTAAYDSPMQPHFRGTWTRSGTTFGYELRQGDVVASRADDIQISQHPDVRVVTWNHLLTVGKTSADRPLEAPLLPLDDVTYRDEKVTRRD